MLPVGLDYQVDLGNLVLQLLLEPLSSLGVQDLLDFHLVQGILSRLSSLVVLRSRDFLLPQEILEDRESPDHQVHQSSLVVQMDLGILEDLDFLGHQVNLQIKNKLFQCIGTIT